MTGDRDLDLYLAGRISAEVALVRRLLAGASPDEVAARLGPSDSPRGRALLDLIAARRDGLRQLCDMFTEMDHLRQDAAPEDSIPLIRETFDRAVAISPEASVAAYSLGDRDILAAATNEIVAWLDDVGLIGPEADVLDFGCGIGRIAAALAPRVRSALGLDISPAMIGEARRRCTAPNLEFEITSGADLAFLPAARFDLVLAVDSVPYLVQAGRALAERLVADAARVLRDGGALVILNLSYRSDPAADVLDAKRWAAAHDFVPAVLGDAPFTLWDGRAFVLRRR